MPPSQPSSLPTVLTIAGSDSSAGAGVQADLKTFASLGCYGVTALTSIVAETPAHVVRIELLSPEIITAQIGVLGEAFQLGAAKTGMLGGLRQIRAVIDAWQSLPEPRAPLVVDPVMVATSGRRLLEEDAMELLISSLLPMAYLVTPNLDEATVLTGERIATRADMESTARNLAARFGTAILLKGGHLSGDDAPDVLIQGREVHWLEGRRIPGVHTHGTGCACSAAIAAGLAKGLSLLEAVRQAKTFVTAAIAGYFRWNHGGKTLDALNHWPGDCE